MAADAAEKCAVSPASSEDKIWRRRLTLAALAAAIAASPALAAKSEYRLTGECYGLEGPQKKARASLIVSDPRNVTYNGNKYIKCE